MIVRLRSLLMNAVFFLSAVVICFVMLWTLPLPRRCVLVVVHIWQRQIAWIEKYIGGIDYRVIGRSHVPKGSCIIASKHQSSWETYKLHILFGDPAIVLKRELLSVPVWGWYLNRSGVIAIDRGGRNKALSGMLRAAHRAVEEGRKIVIFPQGTRIAPGVSKPYKSGVAALYQELHLPIVPMAVNSGVFSPKNSFFKKPGTITIEFLPPIPPGLSREEMMSRLKDSLESASDRLVREVS